MIILKGLKVVPIMNNKNMNKKTSTFERVMSEPKRKAKFDQGYNEFLLNEFLLEAMEENNISVRKLAKKAGVSPAVIQNIRSGKTSNITLKKLNNIASVLGYQITLSKVK